MITENIIIYIKNPNGFELWREYDENDNEIHYKDSTGYEYWQGYDEYNNLIYSKDSNGYECWNDSKGKEITEKEYIINILIKWKQKSHV